MAVKLSSLTYSKKIPKWIYLRAYICSVSCAKVAQIIPGNDQNSPNTSEFEEKIQTLKGHIYPDSLIRVLDSTYDLNSSVRLFKWVSLQKRFHHTAGTYYRIILRLGMWGNVEEMEGFCNEMVKERCPGTEEALVGLIDSFIGYSRLNEALRIFMTMNSAGYKPSIGVFNVLMGALVGEKRNFQDVLFVYKEMVKAGIVPTIDTLNHLIEALFEADRVETALDQYRRMNNKGCSPNTRTFEILISGLVAKNLVDESIVILDEMFEHKFETNLSFYRRIMPLYCRLDKPEVVTRLFKMMKASNVPPDSQLHEVLIHCLCNNSRWNDAIKLVEEMEKSDLTPFYDILADIINCFCKSGKVHEAATFLESKHVLGSHPHNVLLGGYCNASNFYAAEVLLANMLDRNIADTVSWNIIIRWLSENKRINKTLEFLCRMIVSSYVLDSATFSALVVGKCRVSRYEDALKLFHQVCAKSWVLDSTSYGELVECLCQSEMVQEAAELFRYMSSKKCTLRLSSFITLVKRLCVTGNVYTAINLSLAYDSGPFSTATCNAIMHGLSKLQKGKDLFVVLSRMLVEGYALDRETYDILIENMLAIGCIDDCVLFFNLMANEGLLPNLDTLFSLLSCLVNCSQLYRIVVAIDKLVTIHDMLNLAMYNVLIKINQFFSSKVGLMSVSPLHMGNSFHNSLTGFSNPVNFSPSRQKIVGMPAATRINKRSSKNKDYLADEVKKAITHTNERGFLLDRFIHNLLGYMPHYRGYRDIYHSQTATRPEDLSEPEPSSPLIVVGILVADLTTNECGKSIGVVPSTVEADPSSRTEAGSSSRASTQNPTPQQTISSFDFDSMASGMLPVPSRRGRGSRGITIGRTRTLTRTIPAAKSTTDVTTAVPHGPLTSSATLPPKPPTNTITAPLTSQLPTTATMTSSTAVTTLSLIIFPPPIAQDSDIPPPPKKRRTNEHVLDFDEHLFAEDPSEPHIWKPTLYKDGGRQRVLTGDSIAETSVAIGLAEALLLPKDMIEEQNADATSLYEKILCDSIKTVKCATLLKIKMGQLLQDCERESTITSKLLTRVSEAKKRLNS